MKKGLVLLFALMVFSILGNIPLAYATPGWYDLGYKYRVPITISSSYGAGSGYQIPVGVRLNDNVFTFSPERYMGNPFDLPGDDLGYGATHPSPIYFPTAEDGYSYWMYYENGGSYSNETDVEVNLVRSNDGLTWVETGISNPVLEFRDEGIGLHDPHVIRVGSTWYMWYGARHETPDDFTIGYATSNDGKTWTNVDSSVIESSPTWCDRGVFSPSVIYRGGTFYMVYNGLDVPWGVEADSSLGYAWSTNGQNWTLYSGNPVMTASQGWEMGGIWHCNIAEYKGRVYIWYSGYPAPSPGLGFGIAYTTDYITWIKSDNNPFMYSTTEWENARLYTPSPLRYDSNQSLVFLNREVYLYYSANIDIGGVVHKIGLAIEKSWGYYNLEGLALTSMNDVLFTDDSGDVLDLYKERIVIGEFSVFWVEVPDNLNTSDSTIWMYYNNPSATSDNSDGSDTFEYFDDFEGASLGADWQISGTPDLAVGNDYGDTWVRLEDDDSIYSSTTFGYGYAVKTNATVNEQDSWFVQFKDGHGSLPANSIDVYVSDSIDDGDFDHFQLRTMNDYPPDYNNLDMENFDTFNEPVWHTYEVGRNMTNNIVYGFQDDNLMNSSTLQIPSPVLGIGFQVEDSSVESALTVDWILVRKFVYPEPTVTYGVGAFRVPWFYEKIDLIIGIAGLGMFVISPAYIYVKASNGEYEDGLTYGLMLLVLGLGLIISWLWS